MLGRVTMVGVVLLLMAVAFYRFGLGRQSVPVDVLFLSMALAAVVLGVRNWAGLLSHGGPAPGTAPGPRETGGLAERVRTTTPREARPTSGCARRGTPRD